MRNMPGRSPNKRLRRASHSHEADRERFTESAGGATPAAGNHLATRHHVPLPAHRPAVSEVFAGKLPGSLQALSVTARSAPAGMVGVSLEAPHLYRPPASQHHARPACVAVAHAAGSAGRFAATTHIRFVAQPGYS